MTHLSEEICAAHRNFSAAALDFLVAAVAEPETRAVPLDFTAAEFPGFMEEVNYTAVQSWPLFLDDAGRREVERVTVGVAQLVRGIPARIFDNDLPRFCRYYGYPNQALAGLLLAPPNGIAGSLGRCDFIDTRKGLQCLEVNMWPNLGGWQTRFWAEKILSSPAVAPFLAERGLAPRYRDPWRELFLHVIADTLPRVSADRVLNVVLTASPGAQPLQALPYFRQVYAEILRELAPDCEGDFLIGQIPGPFRERGGRLFYGDRPVQAVIEHVHATTPQEVFRSFKAGAVNLYNGPLYPMLADKRNLALLSRHAESDRYDADERRILRDNIPWTRELVAGETTYQGEKALLPQLLLAHPERFVVKKGMSRRGEDVCFGPLAPKEKWEAAVQAGLQDGTWIAQEVAEPQPLLGQYGPVGTGIYDAIWGTFVFGTRYGGGYLRMVPRGTGDGVINAARGAIPGLILEL